MSKRALILGAGQDGSYLAELLLSKDYEVHLLHRRSSADNLWRVRHLLDRLTLHKGDLADPVSVREAIERSYPDEIYNEADQDNVDWALAVPAYTWDITFGAVGRLLEAVRRLRDEVQEESDWNPRVFQPLSITMFGDAPPPQDESTPLAPASPYAVAKAAAWLACQHYRREHGLFVSCGIMANHDSPRRGDGYLLHKICRGAVRIAAGLQETLPLSDPEMQVDIGYAPDFMEAAWRILQLDKPNDFVLGTGTGRRILDWALMALTLAKVPGRLCELIVDDPSFRRPGKPPTYIANPTKYGLVGGHCFRNGSEELIGSLVVHYQAKLAKEGTL